MIYDDQEVPRELCIPNEEEKQLRENLRDNNDFL